LSECVFNCPGRLIQGSLFKEFIWNNPNLLKLRKPPPD
jgi:hypothetical protein